LGFCRPGEFEAWRTRWSLPVQHATLCGATARYIAQVKRVGSVAEALTLWQDTRADRELARIKNEQRRALIQAVLRRAPFEKYGAANIEPMEIAQRLWRETLRSEVFAFQPSAKSREISRSFCGVPSGYGSSPLAAQTSTVLMNVQNWAILYSPGMPPASGTQIGGGWYFDFPSDPNSVHYVLAAASMAAPTYQ